MISEHDWPRAHLVADDFFAPAALDTIFKELASVDHRLKPGLVRDIGHDGQSVFFQHSRRRNKALWLHDPSKTLRLFREQLWSAVMLPAFDGAREPLFQIIPNCWAPHLQVSRYMTGDHYDFHEDEGAGVNLTAIVFVAAKPKKVRGGDLVLVYDDQETTIPFRHNRLVVFPSKTLHRVTPVRVDSDDIQDARTSLQCWLSYGRPPTKTKRRAPEADRPTFLLAEASIIAAARALIDTSQATEQTPEDIYWGAFYLSRILSSNLRCLVDALSDAKGARAHVDITMGPVRIRRGAELEVYMRGRLEGVQARVGFLLRGPDVPLTDALSLFVETGRGRAKTELRRVVPPEATEPQTIALLRRLLARTPRAS